MDRYHRQELIEGWDQAALEKSRAVIIGSGNLASYSAVCLAALGIGNVEIYDSAKVELENEFLYFSASPGEAKAKALETILGEINPDLRVKGNNMQLANSPLISMVGKPDVIIDATNSPESKRSMIEYGNAKEVPVISAAVDQYGGEIYISRGKSDDGLLERFSGREQGLTSSGIIGGILSEEVRKIIMPLGDYDFPLKTLTYSMASPIRFGGEEDQQELFDLAGKKVLMVGAGALGNFVGLGMAMLGASVDILDYDEIESTNLNRQILFYDSVGKLKAEALAAKIKQINPQAEVKGIVAKLDQHSDYFSNNQPDLIVDCVDSFAVRAIINYFAVREGIPLISGGTNPKSGQVVAYQPGKTACLDCKMGVETALAEQRKATSCRYAPDPSVIMTNQIIGNMVVGEAMAVLSGNPIQKILKYDAEAPRRGGLVGSEESCSCAKPGVEEWLAQVDSKV